MPSSMEQKRAWLEGVPLFRGCSPDVLERLAAVTSETDFAPGQPIVQQGQVGNGLFIVVAGTARVSRAPSSRTWARARSSASCPSSTRSHASRPLPRRVRLPGARLVGPAGAARGRTRSWPATCCPSWRPAARADARRHGALETRTARTDLHVAEHQVVDTLAGLALFADLGRPQLTAVAHTFSEESFPPGQRILRQGFTGTGFYVILEGEVSVGIDGEERVRLGKGEFFGEISILLGEPPVADITAVGPLRVLHLAGPDLQRLPAGPPDGDVPDAPVGVAPAGPRQRPLTRRPEHAMSSPTDPRPLSAGRVPRGHRRLRAGRPPGVVPPGPHGHPARGHLRGPGSRRHVPALPVLPAAAVVDQALRGAGARLAPVRALRLEQPAGRRAGESGAPGGPDGRLLAVPVAAGDGGGPGAASRSAPGVRVRYGTRGRAPRATASGSCSTPTDGDYRTPYPIFAVGVAEPFLPDTPGTEHVAHYVDTRDAASYAGKRLFIVGKQNCGFELASRAAPVGEPASSSPPRARPSCRSTRTRWRASGRATCSPGRTPTWAAAWPSSTRRSSGTSGTPTRHPRPHAPLRQRRGVRDARSTRSSRRPASRARCWTCRRSAWPPSASRGCR